MIDDISLLILVPFNQITNEIIYSLSNGLNGFQKFKFSEEPSLVEIIIKDKFNPYKFYIYTYNQHKGY